MARDPKLRFSRRFYDLGAALSSGGSLAVTGAKGGSLAVTFDALGRVGKSLVDQGYKQHATEVLQQAKQNGASAADQAALAGSMVKLRQDETLAAVKFNDGARAAYLGRLKTNAEAMGREIAARYPADPQKFAADFANATKAMSNQMPPEWKPDMTRMLDAYGTKLQAGISVNAIRQQDAAHNADNLKAADSAEADVMQAARDGNASAILSGTQQVKFFLDARTDIPAQRKAQMMENYNLNIQRNQALGGLDRVIATGGVEAGAAYINAFQADKKTVADPTQRDKIVGEMAAKLRDAENAQNVAARQDAARQKSENAGKISTLEINISRGVATQTDVANADRAGLFVDNLSARVRLYKAVDQVALKQQKEAAQVVLGAEFMSGKALADPKNPEQRKAIDAYYTATVAPTLAKMNGPEASAEIANIVTRTGIIPDQVKSGIRAALSAGNGDAVVWASDMVARIQEADPKALAVFAKNDLALAQTVNKLVLAGVDPSAAVVRARADTDPANEVQRNARLAEIKTQEYSADYSGWISSRYNSVVLTDFWPTGSSNDVSLDNTQGTALQAEADFGTLFKDWFLRTGDKTIAKANALRELSRTWGASAINGGTASLMKYPPEAYYGINSTGLVGTATDADGAWMRKQLLADIGDKGFWGDPVKDPLDGRTRLEADTTTAREVGAGQPPSYVIFVKDAYGAYQPVIGAKGVILRWHPDPAKEHARLFAKARKAAQAMRDLVGKYHSNKYPIGPFLTGAGNAVR